jgi:hypothetical protein
MNGRAPGGRGDVGWGGVGGVCAACRWLAWRWPWCPRSGPRPPGERPLPREPRPQPIAAPCPEPRGHAAAPAALPQIPLGSKKRITLGHTTLYPIPPARRRNRGCRDDANGHRAAGAAAPGLRAAAPPATRAGLQRAAARLRAGDTRRAAGEPARGASGDGANHWPNIANDGERSELSCSRLAPTQAPQEPPPVRLPLPGWLRSAAMVRSVQAAASQCQPTRCAGRGLIGSRGSLGSLGSGGSRGDAGRI